MGHSLAADLEAAQSEAAEFKRKFGAGSTVEDLDNSPAYHTWWTGLPHEGMGWTAQHYGYEAWRERGRRDAETINQLHTDLAQAQARISELEQSHAECARTADLERAVVEAARAVVRPVIPPPLSKLWELSDVLRVLDAATATKGADA